MIYISSKCLAKTVSSSVISVSECSVRLYSQDVRENVCMCVCVCVYIYIYTASQKFGISMICNVFKGVSSAHQGCIYSIKKTLIL